MDLARDVLAATGPLVLAPPAWLPFAEAAERLARAKAAGASPQLQAAATLVKRLGPVLDGFRVRQATAAAVSWELPLGPDRALVLAAERVVVTWAGQLDVGAAHSKLYRWTWKIEAPHPQVVPLWPHYGPDERLWCFVTKAELEAAIGQLEPLLARVVPPIVAAARRRLADGLVYEAPLPEPKAAAARRPARAKAEGPVAFHVLRKRPTPELLPWLANTIVRLPDPTAGTDATNAVDILATRGSEGLDGLRSLLADARPEVARFIEVELARLGG